jgi:hypothetical protein
MMYSILLYIMKTRVTFRVAPDLADALRDLPNQTQFVEQALREALREKCPACGGSGRASTRSVKVSNFRQGQLPPLQRELALQLRQLMIFARRAAATDLGLREAQEGLAFVLSRGSEILLEGSLTKHSTRLELGGGSN